jgi:hypothetical protein
MKVARAFDMDLLVSFSTWTSSSVSRRSPELERFVVFANAYALNS